MTVDIFERYASLDPAKAPGTQPEWSEAAPVLSAASDWSEPDMQSQQQTPTQPPKPKQNRTGVLVAAAAIALVAIVGTVVLVTSSDDTASPATSEGAGASASSTTTSPIESTTITTVATIITPSGALAVGESFIAAYNAGDAEVTMALVLSDAFIDWGFGEDVTWEDEEMRMIWNAAQGTTLTTEDCQVLGESTETTVQMLCKVSTQPATAQALDRGAVRTHINMAITPEGISRLEFSYFQPDFGYVDNPFARWMQANHPEDAHVVTLGSWST
jgi:hypothetical protein